jgi:homoserine kinase
VVIRVRVPATSANLGPGFDAVGVALGLFLEVDMSLEGSGYQVSFSGEGADYLRVAIGDNLVYRAARKVFDETGRHPEGVYLKIRNAIPVGKGLGSSAAATVAGLWGANALLGCPLTEDELLRMAVKMEGHPENVVPAVVGGLAVAMVDQGTVLYRRLDLPVGLRFLLAVPDFGVATEHARRALPAMVEMGDAVYNLQRACFFLASMLTGQLDHLDRAMRDRLHQPYRKMFVAGFDDVVEGAVRAGALGAAMSGSGPAVLALARGETEGIARAMREGFERYGVRSAVCELEPCVHGVVIEEE